MSILDALREKRATLETELDALISAEDFNPSDDTFVRAKADAEALDAKIKAIVEHESRRAAADKIDALSLSTARAVTKERTSGTIGEAWTRSKAYEDYRTAPRGTSGNIAFDADTLFRAPILTPDLDGIYQNATLPDVVDRNPWTPLLDLVPRVLVANGSVEWVHYPEAPAAGGPVAEGTDKPEMIFEPELVTVTLDVLAHYVAYSRQVLEDKTALMRYLNAALRSGVLRKAEAQLASVLTGASLPVTTQDTLIKGIRHGIANVQEAGYMPTAVVLNPSDFADLDVDLLGQTVVDTGTGPRIGQTYWGVRPIPASSVAPGTAYLGDFGEGMVNLMRSDVQVYSTDSHADFFKKNLLVTLAEVRMKGVVQQPQALTKIEVA